MQDKRGVLWSDYLGYLLIGFVFLILAISIYMIVTGKAQSSLDFIKNLFLVRR